MKLGTSSFGSVCTFQRIKRSKYICAGTLNFQDLSTSSVRDSGAPAVLSASTAALKTERESEGGWADSPPLSLSIPTPTVLTQLRRLCDWYPKQRPSDKLYWDNKWAGTLVAPQGTLVMYLEYCLVELCIHPPVPPPNTCPITCYPLLLSSSLPNRSTSAVMSDVISSHPGIAAASWSNLVLTPTQFLHPLRGRNVLNYRSKSGQSVFTSDSIFFFFL